MYNYDNLPTFNGEPLDVFRYRSGRYDGMAYVEVNAIPSGMDAVYLGNLERDPMGDLLWLPVSSGSDYGGDTVTRSNYEYFLEEYEDIALRVYGGHGTYGVLIPVWFWNDGLEEDLKSLEDYPSIDDDRLSDIELGLEEDAWEDWVRHDFSSMLEDAGIEEMEEDALRNLFHAALERGNDYAIHEMGCNVYYDLDRIVPNALALLEGN